MFAMSSNPNRLSISQMAAAKPPAAKSEAEYLDGLNPEQREAVLTLEALQRAGQAVGAVRVDRAGAGDPRSDAEGHRSGRHG